MAGKHVVTIFGIKNCDTMNKARAWLDARRIEHQFHDYKTLGVDGDLLRGWVVRLGWEVVLNRAGTTFRALADADKAGLDADRAAALMLANPSMIKRPVVVRGGDVMIGFKPENYAAFFAGAGLAGSAGATDIPQRPNKEHAR